MKNFINKNKKISSIALLMLILFFSKKISAETNYIPPEPFLIIGDNFNTSSSEEISKKISSLQDQNKDMRAKILSLQDLLVSRYKDRIELKIEIISEQTRELPQFGIIELYALMNNIEIINYSKPVFFEKNSRLPIFSGPLPVGTYEVNIHALVGQQNNNWPYTLPQGKWSLDKKIFINGTLNQVIHNIKVYLKPNKETKIPEFVLKSEVNKEEKE
ncbi:hypothetical protein [Silvanigrella aquatica]|uniref:DUF3859 domain-containing protein n=1 Tax=Silvanigrella aquatica TaxID=1915309 RepID=A0A1L4CXH0_9BACT|nr:hypothetical protein [Silvanigrella aquatica]APJ02653.1 hypothetical protein AXG55_01380 [Silvanigrella aquatica]